MDIIHVSRMLVLHAYKVVLYITEISNTVLTVSINCNHNAELTSPVNITLIIP